MKDRRVISVVLIVCSIFASCGLLGLAKTPEVGVSLKPEPLSPSTIAHPTQTPESPTSPKLVFNHCLPDQKASLKRALGNAQKLAFNALQVLKNTPESQRESSTRYREWFGDYDPSNYKTVMTNFQAIYQVLATQTITFYCDCSEVYLAYAGINHPYDIHPCTEFWELPALGTDSQAGVLLHEISHFPKVAGTKDEVYGHAVARVPTGWTSPATAIINAANYQYYAENTPSLEPIGPAAK